MPIVTNESQDEDVVLGELKTKLSIEAKFKLDLKKFFKAIVLSQKEEFSLKSLKKKNINVQEFAPRLTTLLFNNYNNAISKANTYFTSDPAVQDLISPQEQTRIIEQSTLLSQEYAANRSIRMSEEIMQTTKKNLVQSTTYIDKMILQTGVELTTDERNSLILENFDKRLQNRVGTIAATETQNVYQEAKKQEALMTNEVLNRSGQNMQKRWNAMLDQHTRPAHVNANGQRVNLQALFEVGGEELEYPSDDSHGATVKNIANCRCESLYIIL